MKPVKVRVIMSSGGIDYDGVWHDTIYIPFDERCQLVVSSLGGSIRMCEMDDVKVIKNQEPTE